MTACAFPFPFERRVLPSLALLGVTPPGRLSPFGIILEVIDRLPLCSKKLPRPPPPFLLTSSLLISFPLLYALHLPLLPASQRVALLGSSIEVVAGLTSAAPTFRPVYLEVAPRLDPLASSFKIFEGNSCAEWIRRNARHPVRCFFSLTLYSDDPWIFLGLSDTGGEAEGRNPLIPTVRLLSKGNLRSQWTQVTPSSTELFSDVRDAPIVFFLTFGPGPKPPPGLGTFSSPLLLNIFPLRPTVKVCDEA